MKLNRKERHVDWEIITGKIVEVQLLERKKVVNLEQSQMTTTIEEVKQQNYRLENSFSTRLSF